MNRIERKPLAQEDRSNPSESVTVCELGDTLVITVQVPRAETMADLDLSLSHDQLSLAVRDKPEPVVVALDESWDKESARAKFSKKKRELTVSLQLKATV